MEGSIVGESLLRAVGRAIRLEKRGRLRARASAAAIGARREREHDAFILHPPEDHPLRTRVRVSACARTHAGRRTSHGKRAAGVLCRTIDSADRVFFYFFFFSGGGNTSRCVLRPRHTISRDSDAIFHAPWRRRKEVRARARARVRVYHDRAIKRENRL